MAKPSVKHPFIFPLIIVIVATGIVIMAIIVGQVEKPPKNTNTTPTSSTKLATYDSCQAIATAFEESGADRNQGFKLFDAPLGLGMMEKSAESVPVTGGSTSEAPEYSKTNIQVEGVDEADIVKTDGSYIYTVTGNKLSIAKAYPADEAKVVSQTTFDNITPQEIFIHKNTLLLFGYSYDYYDDLVTMDEKEIMPRQAYSFTTIELWNILSKESPEKIRTIEIEGDYLTSRKIDEDVYFVINTYPYYYDLEDDQLDEIVPLYRDRQKSALDKDTSFSALTKCGDVSYFPEIEPEQFVTVASVSMSSPNSEINKEVIAGYGENVYASTQNLYIAEEKYPYYSSGWWIFDDSDDQEELTYVHKFSLEKGEIEYQGNAEVPGSILNQFSMDEYNNYFRIATTTGHVSRSAEEATAANNIYILDQNLKQTGALEDLAPGEEIYSARFMGDRGYLVTFKKVDPLFAIDLSDPTDPTVLGKLKIPGYSDYLHPYDENHLIGVGKETVEAEEGDFAWYQGIKMAVFDVTDVENPQELHKVIIGDRGTDSYALDDHKAFLFDKNKNLLVIPVLLAELTEAQKAQEYTGSTYGDYTYQGAYVYDLTLENGFQLKGRVTHYDTDEVFKKSGYYYYGDDYSVMRSLYIDDVLYTISGEKIKLNALADLADISTLDL